MQSRLFVLRCVLTGLAALSPALHVSTASAADGYVTQGSDKGAPLRSTYGDCVHDGEWRPGLRFADCEPAPVVSVAAPTPPPAAEPPVAEAPAPAPAPAPQPIVLNVPFRLSTDAFFDFDKSTLRPEGHAALDQIASQLAGTNYDAITIVGHADRIGNPGYNQRLSERRAAAMADYLVAKGVDLQKISSSGVGSSETTTSCPQQLRGPGLIACLQPDRVAEVKVSGTAAQVAAVPSSLASN